MLFPEQFNLNCMDFTVAASGPITLKTSLYLKGNFNNDGALDFVTTSGYNRDARVILGTPTAATLTR